MLHYIGVYLFSSFARSKSVSSGGRSTCATGVVIVVFVVYLFNILLPDTLLIWYDLWNHINNVSGNNILNK